MATCTPYVECDKRESWQSLFKRLIVEQEDGSLALRVTCCTPSPPPELLALELTWDSIANVPVADASSVSDWNTFFFGAIPDPLLYTTMFTSVTVVGNVVKLYGGSGITLKALLFTTTNPTALVSIVDNANCVISLDCTSLGSNYTPFYDDDTGYGCDGLITCDLPLVITAGDSCFAYCTSLTGNFSAFTTAGNDCFVGCTALVSPDFSVLASVGNSCFQNCTSLVSPNFSALTTAGDNCFNGCTLLNTNFTVLITAGNYCFVDCASFVNPDFSSLTTAGNNCFQNCTDLESPIFSSLITIGDGCFNGDNAITTINIPLCTSLGTTTYDDNVFNGITGLTITVTCDPDLLTCNGGAPDGDLCYLAANNLCTINGTAYPGGIPACTP